MPLEDNKTAAGTELKTKPPQADGAGSGSEPDLKSSRDTEQGEAAVSLRKESGMGQSQTYRTTAPRKVKVKQSELIFFTTQLAVMLDSGVVLSDALDSVVEQSDPSTFRTVISDVAESVKRGQSFSASLSPYPKVFNSMFISMVKASEASGKMVEMLRLISDYLNFEEDIRRRVKGALTYPLIMMVIATIAMSIMMFFVLPKFTKIYESKGAALPKVTQMLLGLSTVVSDGQKMMSVVTVLLVTAVAGYYWLGTAGGRRTLDFLKIRIPVLGTMFTDLVVTRSMRIMATMMDTGVNLLDAIEVIRGSCDNYYFQRLWSATDKNIRDGYQLSDSIEIAVRRGRSSPRLSAKQEEAAAESPRHVAGSSSWKLVNPGVVHMIRAGESSGQLGQVSDKISVFYGKKLDASIKSVTALVEPLMIVVLGAIIGFVAIALLLPVFRISTIIAH